VTSVGLFVDAEPAFVREVLAQVPLDLLQFHGDEPPEYCAAFGRAWIKAVRMRPGLELAAQASRYGAGVGLLLDAYDPQVAGGTGRTFDWGPDPPSGSPPGSSWRGGSTPGTWPTRCAGYGPGGWT
jgi:phosphoribosylanthranilate isomerase